MRSVVVACIVLQAAVVSGLSVLRLGYVLINDSVAVPQQSLLPWMWGGAGGPPRSVPQDAIVAVVDNVVPGGLLQSLMILGGTSLLGLGVAHLLNQRSGFEQVAAASVAMWSVYVYERSLMGHWGLLLGLAALPWVVDAACDVRARRAGSLRRLLGWSLLGSVVPSAGVLQLAAVAVVLLWPPLPRLRTAAGALGGVLALQLVWIIPGVRAQTEASTIAAEVFGLRGEGFSGPVLTGLGTGGIWNSAVVPESRLGVMSLIAPVALLVIAGLGASRLRHVRPVALSALLFLSAAGLGWALLTAVPSAAQFVAQVESLPGGGLLRDSQKWIAPWVVALSLSAGLGLGRLRERLHGTDAWWPGSILLLLLPILLLPDLAFGAWGRITPVAYPAEWSRVHAYLSASARPGDVVSLPWSAFRSYEWNQNWTVLDPSPRYLPRPVVTDTRLLVQRADGLAVVPSDDPRSALVADALRTPAPAAALRDLGIGWVLWQGDQPATPGYPASPPDWLDTAGRTVVDGRDLDLIELAEEARAEPAGRPDVLLMLAWAGWLLILISVLAGLLRHLWSVRRGTRGTAAPGSGTLTASD